MARNALQCITIAIVWTTALSPVIAFAASFQVIEQGPSRMGTAFAGTASATDDATTVFFNPAGMSRLDRPMISAGANLILPDADFNNQGSTDSFGKVLRGPNDGVDNEIFVPNFYYAHPLSDRLAIGIGVNVPFGLTTEYDNDWIGRYHATDSELTLFNINPTLSYRFSERLSFGIGINYQRMDTTLENEVDSFAACTQAPGASPAACAGGLLGTALSPGQRAQDSSTKIDGDDTDLAIDLSLLFEISDSSRIGIVFREGGNFRLTGDAGFNQSAACAGNAGCSGGWSTLEGRVAADIEMPDVVTVSISHGLNNGLTLHGDIGWTGWSSIDEVRVVNTTNGITVSTLDFDYDDTMRYAFGLSYHNGGAWTWRAGIAFDEAPQTSPTLQTPRVPDEDRTWLSFGFNYAFSERATIDFGYAHLFADDIRINNAAQGNTLTGKYDASIDILGIQGNWTF